MGDEERFERAADGLCEVSLAIEAVDLNTLTDDDVRRLLAAKAVVDDMCQRCRQNQRAAAGWSDEQPAPNNESRT